MSTNNPQPMPSIWFITSLVVINSLFVAGLIYWGWTTMAGFNRLNAPLNPPANTIPTLDKATLDKATQ